MTCEFAHLDGSYVLGALSPSERLDFERHLSQCAECSRSVRELAGLPGLLAQVDLADLGEVAPPLPDTLLPALVRTVRGAQRRRSVLIGAVAASVSAVAVGALAVAIAGGPDGARDPGAAPPTAVTSSAPGRPMVAVGPTPVRADVVVTDVAWGTRLDLTCSYAVAKEDYDASPAAVYALVIRTRDGRTEQVATWRGVPGRTMRVSGATATSRGEIETVELRTADGVVVLRLSV